MPSVRVINANYTKLFYGMAVSAVGDFVFDTTLILWISTRLLVGKDYASSQWFQEGFTVYAADGGAASTTTRANRAV